MKKKFLMLSLIFILILSLFSVTSMAASTYSFTTSMTANNSKVTAGSEVLITVKLSNLNVGENGINQFSAYLSYDTDVFETLTDSSVDGVNGWVPNYTTGTGKVSLYRPTFLKTDEEIMQISLKTKKDLTDGVQGEVKLSTIIVSDSIDEITASPVSTSITVGDSTIGNPVVTNPSTTAEPIQLMPNTNNTNTNTAPVQIPVQNSVPKNNTIEKPVSNNLIITPSNNNVGGNGIQVVNNTQAEADIPYTGTDTGALARIIIGVICIGLVLYIKIERMNKEIK